MAVPNWAARRTNCFSKVNNVAVVGGTHGNEINGLFVAKYFMKNPDLVKRPSFRTTTLLSNTASVEANRRYVETDMNRCFLLKDLQDDKLQTLEHKRAREIDQTLGPKDSTDPGADIVFDLHNTTANSGFLLLMAPGDDFAHMIAAYLMQKDPAVRVCQWRDVPDWPLLPTVGRSGMTVEVGPIPHSTAEAKWFQSTKDHIQSALDFIEAHNQGVAAQPASPKRGRTAEKVITINVFQLVGNVDYPRDESGELTGLIHPDRQGSDFTEIKHGEPAFLLHDGSVQAFDATPFKGEEPLYSFFVNEAAYYEKSIAFCVARRVERKIEVPSWLVSML